MVREVQVKVKRLTAEEFEEFGTVIELPKTSPTFTSDILDYWDAVANMGDVLVDIGYLVVKHRPFEFTKMERHVKTPEGFIPLGGGCSIFPLAPAGGLDKPEATPKPEEIVAFILDGTKGVILKPGVWHWAPFPLGDQAHLLVLLRRGTVKDDLDIKDLRERLGVKMRITL